MITQSLKLNLIPGQVLPRINVSQYDNGTRTLQMALYNGEQVFNIASGMSGFVQGTKPDRTGFQYAANVTVGSNIVTLDVTQQMAAVSGEVICELVIANGDDRIATVNFVIYVEPAALADDTIISETQLPLIEEAAELAQEIEGYMAEIDADADRAESYAVGTIDGEPVDPSDPTYHNNSKYYSEQAAASAQGVETYAEESEAWAVGKRGGVPVTSGDETYENNSKYYANEASDSATSASNSAGSASDSAEDSEAYAIGKRNGTDVTSEDPAYHNNSKYYAGEADTSATNAGLSASAAAQSEEDAEAWAVGERGGVPVPSGDPTYENSAKYWAQQASGAVNDMTGATATTPGAHGLVPAPSAGDQDKVLHGDGTWKSPVTSLAGLSDTTITTPTDGQVLAYVNADSKWENKSLGTAATKNSTNAVTQGSTDLVESGAVYTGLDAKQPKTLATPLTVDGVQQTTNEGALGAINTLAGNTKTGLANEAVTRSAMGAKNLLVTNHYVNTTTYRGVTLTINEDGSISMSGIAEATENIAATITWTENATFLQKYIGKSLVLSSESNSNAYVGMPIADSGQQALIHPTTSSGEATFTVPSGATYFALYVHVTSGVNYTGKTIYPMLRLATDFDPTYQPYAMTNRELTENVTTETEIKTCTFESHDYTIKVSKNGKLVNIHMDEAIIYSLANANNLIGSGFPVPINGSAYELISSSAGFYRIIVDNEGKLYIYAPTAGNTQFPIDLMYISA